MVAGITGAVLAAGIEAFLIVYVLSKYEVQIYHAGKKTRRILCMAGIALSALWMNILMAVQLRYDIFQAANQILIYVLLVILAGIDYHCHRIPNRLILIGGGIRAALLAAEGMMYPDMWKQSVIASVVGLLASLILMLLLAFLTKQGIGYGDVKLFALLGFCAGLKNMYYILFYSVLLAAVAGIFLMAVKKADRKKRLPFAPFILVGYFAVFLML